MIKISIDYENQRDEFEVSSMLLAASSNQNKSDIHSLIIGEFSSDEILDFATGATSTALKAILDDLSERTFAPLESLSKAHAFKVKTELFDKMWDRMKKAVFELVFEDYLKELATKPIEISSLEEAKELTNILKNLSDNFTVELGAINLDKLKEQAKDALRVNSVNDIHVDIEELLKQIKGGDE